MADKELRFTLEDKEIIEKIFFSPKDRVTYDIIDDEGIEYKHIYIKKDLLKSIKEKSTKLKIPLKIKENREPGITRKKKVFGIKIFPYKAIDIKGQRVIRVTLKAPHNKLCDLSDHMFEELKKRGINYKDCVWG